MIEGRFPRIYISSNIAQIVGDKVNYIDNKGLDNTYYRDYIINYLKEFKKATRQEINQFIYPKLPSTFSEEDKNKRVKYLLTTLRKQNIIINNGSDTRAIWILKDNFLNSLSFTENSLSCIKMIIKQVKNV